MRPTSGPSPKTAPSRHEGRLGRSQTGMLSPPASRQGLPRAGKSHVRPSKPVLASDQSAVLRDRLVAEVDRLHSADEAAGWAHRSLPAKNTLTAGDAALVEEGFEARLGAFGDGRPADGPREAVQTRPGVQPCLPGSPAAATAVLGRVAAAGSGRITDNPRKTSAALNNHPDSSASSGIDKSVLAIGEPRRIRAKAHARKSTGPVTEVGKQRSRCNAVRHCLTAETVIGTLEDAEDYQAFEAKRARRPRHSINKPKPAPKSP
jgi:hypothetical protein